MADGHLPSAVMKAPSMNAQRYDEEEEESEGALNPLPKSACPFCSMIYQEQLEFTDDHGRSKMHLNALERLDKPSSAAVSNGLEKTPSDDVETKEEQSEAPRPVCGLCAENFASVQELKECPYICGLCGDTFAQSEDLRVHHASHSKTSIIRHSDAPPASTSPIPSGCHQLWIRRIASEHALQGSTATPSRCSRLTPGSTLITMSRSQRKEDMDSEVQSYFTDHTDLDPENISAAILLNDTDSDDPQLLVCEEEMVDSSKDGTPDVDEGVAESGEGSDHTPGEKNTEWDDWGSLSIDMQPTENEGDMGVTQVPGCGDVKDQ
nr:hypothetical protein BaRGS_021243 [Batillaria attramentaria]